MTSIKTPHDHDVLSGRGGKTFKHIGNYTFRHLVLLNKKLYASSTRNDKIKISQAIVAAIRRQNPPGRYLAYNPRSETWSDIGNGEAIKKTSQALREGQVHIRKELINQMTSKVSKKKKTYCKNRNKDITKAAIEEVNPFCRNDQPIICQNSSTPSKVAVKTDFEIPSASFSCINFKPHAIRSDGFFDYEKQNIEDVKETIGFGLNSSYIRHKTSQNDLSLQHPSSATSMVLEMKRLVDVINKASASRSNCQDN